MVKTVIHQNDVLFVTARGRVWPAVIEWREVKPTLKVGICGEHGGDPESVEFCHREGFTYVSCSAFRVPIARLAAAQAAAKDILAKKKHK